MDRIPDFEFTHASFELLTKTTNERNLSPQQLAAVRDRANVIRGESLAHSSQDGIVRVQQADVVQAIGELTKSGVIPPPPDIEHFTMRQEVRRACERQIEAADMARGVYLLMMRATASGRPGAANPLLTAVALAHAQCLATASVCRDLIRALDANPR